MNINKLRWFLLFFLIITSLACGISLKDDSANEVEALQLQLTRQSLQMTQSVGSANQNQDNQPQPAQGSSGTSGDQSNSQAPIVIEEEEDDGIPCNDSHIIGETIKDGTVYQAGSTFEKTWTLRNEGDCDWTTDYEFKFIEGSRMGGASKIDVPSVIEPNEDITFKVNLTAPNTAGDYTGVWQLFTDDGEEMGRYWVKITVGQPAPPPAAFSVTSVNLYFTNDGGVDNVCANIKTSSAGKVTYKWEDDSGSEQSGSLDFASAEMKTTCVNDINLCPTCWAKIYIDTPNHQWFGPINTP